MSGLMSCHWALTRILVNCRTGLPRSVSGCRLIDQIDSRPDHGYRTDESGRDRLGQHDHPGDDAEQRRQEGKDRKSRGIVPGQQPEPDQITSKRDYDTLVEKACDDDRRDRDAAGLPNSTEATGSVSAATASW